MRDCIKPREITVDANYAGFCGILKVVGLWILIESMFLSNY
jgi:hypothetical protein